MAVIDRAIGESRQAELQVTSNPGLQYCCAPGKLIVRFLDADTQLSNRRFPSIRPLVRLLVCDELKNTKTRIFNAAVVIVCESV